MKRLTKEERAEQNIKRAKELFKYVIPEQLTETQKEVYDMRLKGMYDAQIARKTNRSRQSIDSLVNTIVKNAKKNKAIFDAMLEMKEEEN